MSGSDTFINTTLYRPMIELHVVVSYVNYVKFLLLPCNQEGGRERTQKGAWGREERGREFRYGNNL